MKELWGKEPPSRLDERYKYPHFCENTVRESALWGDAITYCYTAPNGGGMWAGNDEYESRVNFCPFCGEKYKK